MTSTCGRLLTLCYADSTLITCSQQCSAPGVSENSRDGDLAALSRNSLQLLSTGNVKLTLGH